MSNALVVERLFAVPEVVASKYEAVPALIDGADDGRD
jgi:hypothetical protein